MQGFLRVGLVVACLILISGSFVAAYSVSPTIIEPKGSLVPGTKVTVNFTINNPQSDSNDFPVAADLEMFSELEKATWSIAILYEGEQKPLPVFNGPLSGFRNGG